MITDTLPVAGDLLKGSGAISQFVGISSDQVRYLARTGRLPTFRVGRSICSTRSELRAWLVEQQRRRPLYGRR